MNNYLRLFWLVCILVSMSMLSASISQDLIDADSLTVGARFKLVLKADFPIFKVVVPDTLTSFAVLESKRIINKGDLPYAELTITPLRTGSLSFPSLAVHPVDLGQGVEYSSRFRINVLTVRAKDDDKLRDIKTPLRYPWQKPGWFYLLALAMLIAFLTIVLIRILRKKPSSSIQLPMEQVKAQIPLKAWEKGLMRLDELIAMQLCEKGENIEFHFRLAQILRAYLEEEYRIPALEMTSYEIYQKLERLKLGEYRDIRRFLQECDMIKFAKYPADPNTIEERVNWLRSYFESREPFGIIAPKGDNQ